MAGGKGLAQRGKRKKRATRVAGAECRLAAKKTARNGQPPWRFAKNG
jgi:hypothetical protein